MENPHFYAAQRERVEQNGGRLVYHPEHKEFGYGDKENAEAYVKNIPSELKEMKVYDLLINLSDDPKAQTDAVRAIQERLQQDKQLAENILLRVN